MLSYHAWNGHIHRYLVKSWLLAAFLLGMFYAGVLRAYLIKPNYTKSINSIQDIVDSGLSWKLVLYGATYERLMDAQTDEPYVTFWQNKEVVPFDNYQIDIV